MTCDFTRLVGAGLCLLLVAVGSHANLYEDMLMQDLYSRMAGLEDDYNFLPEERDWNTKDIPLDSRSGPVDEIRDHEYLEHGSNSDGWQKISGGAGEGQQHLTPDGTQNNTMEVKSDESLPFYCHPPNPCPKGYTAKDGCQENVQDTASAQKNWIENMQNRGMCACDTEHMFECPDDGNTVGQDGNDATRDSLNLVLDSFLNQYEGKSSPYSHGFKHNSLVAKKSPVTKRNTKPNIQKKSNNPYLGGPKLRVMAKKGMPYHKD